MKWSQIDIVFINETMNRGLNISHQSKNNTYSTINKWNQITSKQRSLITLDDLGCEKTILSRYVTFTLNWLDWFPKSNFSFDNYTYCLFRKHKQKGIHTPIQVLLTVFNSVQLNSILLIIDSIRIVQLNKSRCVVTYDDWKFIQRNISSQQTVKKWYRREKVHMSRINEGISK